MDSQRVQSHSHALQPWRRQIDALSVWSTVNVPRRFSLILDFDGLYFQEVVHQWDSSWNPRKPKTSLEVEMFDVSTALTVGWYWWPQDSSMVTHRSIKVAGSASKWYKSQLCPLLSTENTLSLWYLQKHAWLCPADAELFNHPLYMWKRQNPFHNHGKSPLYDSDYIMYMFMNQYHGYMNICVGYYTVLDPITDHNKTHIW